MDRETLRIWGPRLAVLAAVAACGQIGLLHVVRSERATELEQELADLRRESQQSSSHMAQKVRSAQVQAQRLRAGLARSRAQNAALRLELAEAQASEAALEQRAESATETLRAEPPPLGVRVAPSEPLDGFVAVAENVGRQAVRIVESQGRLWIGGREELLGGGLQDLAVAPGEEVGFFEFGLLSGESGPIAAGSVALRGAVCVVYERSVDAEPEPWARELWFEYRPELRSTAVVQQDRWAPWPGEAACDLAAAQSPW